MTGNVSPVSVPGSVNYVVHNVVKSSNCVPVTGKDYYVTRNLKTRTHLPVFCHVANHVPFAGGSPQKKGVNPDHQMSIKSVKGVSFVDQLISLPNVPLVVPNLPVGLRLQEFWESLAALGVSSKVLAVLREGYTLPFRSRP